MDKVTIDKETGLPVMNNSFARVVRCKDCKHYEGDWWVGDCHHKRWGDGWVNYPPPRVTEDGFCAWGERREDGKNG